MTTKVMQSWHGGHYLYTTPETHPGRWKRFAEIDRFNNGPDGSPNRLDGYIQMKGGDEYGALHIHSVNDRPAQQYIRTTPKAAYPFNRNGHWIMSGQEHVEAFQKLDGTNIFQFTYRDSDENEFTTFKVRLRAGLSEKHTLMLNEVMAKVPAIRELKLPFGTGIGYELNGYKNPHHIRYSYPLMLHMLYARRDGELFGMHDDPEFFDSIDCPKAETHTWTAEEVEPEYRSRQKAYAAATTEVPGEEEYYDGEEGDMLYVRFADGQREQPGSFMRLVKCKSPVIEIIHWRSDRVRAEEILTTAFNLWEVSDNPTVDDLKMLLAEDWTDLQIEMSNEVVHTIYGKVMALRHWQDGVIETFYEVSTSEEWASNHGDSMRAVAATGKYHRSEMRRIFGTLRERL